MSVVIYKFNKFDEWNRDLVVDILHRTLNNRFLGDSIVDSFIKLRDLILDIVRFICVL